MRYCVSVPGAVAFVISQDGDIRVITSIAAGRIVVFENLKLGLEDYISMRTEKSI